MLLHAHPVNEAREARGEPAVNSLWLWGAGPRAAPGRRARGARSPRDDPLGARPGAARRHAPPRSCRLRPRPGSSGCPRTAATSRCSTRCARRVALDAAGRIRGGGRGAGAALVRAAARRVARRAHRHGDGARARRAGAGVRDGARRPAPLLAPAARRSGATHEDRRARLVDGATATPWSPAASIRCWRAFMPARASAARSDLALRRRRACIRPRCSPAPSRPRGCSPTPSRAKKRLLIVADYDADGATACAVGMRALRAFGAQRRLPGARPLQARLRPVARAGRARRAAASPTC